VKRIQSVPLVIGQFLEAVDQNNGIVGSTTGTGITQMNILHCVHKKTPTRIFFHVSMSDV